MPARRGGAVGGDGRARRPPRWGSALDAGSASLGHDALDPGARPRVDDHVGDVDDEVRDQDADHDEQEDALEQEVVAVLDRREDQLAEPRVAEDDLGHERAADDRAERERESGELRQDGVPVGVPADEPAAAPRATAR